MINLGGRLALQEAKKLVRRFDEISIASRVGPRHRKYGCI
jgi:hypothetical protein